ncbi:hypothetical protein FT643_08410 [Ketobacter sp. MCCC 1A13808]|uniref:hypothetical protein n=1 Tax=Ketobacter sp. MCCC 1A13808 TaxID=2602738 RepID=UPI0012EC4D8E|nr:hypothetical protein [Ketobacter sp. MCCC 1A13808]MVF12166.1 hypothetical protein [Ketobacter sp. MCCC 1A13808]
MKGLFTLSNVLLVSALIFVAGFAAWYRGSINPLSVEEQDYFLQQLSQQKGAVAAFLNPEEARHFMATDDGRGFYVINAFKFNDQAQYAEALSPALTGTEAFNKYTRQLAPIWLSAGTHPLFSSTLGRRGYSDWDFVSVVRYRSRRDYFTIQTSEAFLAAIPDRIAATKANFRIKIAGNQMPLPILLLLIIIILLAGLVAAIVALVKQTRLARSLRPKNPKDT